MFYAHIVLAKKGPLARIWLAAHWDKKLTKAHVFETNIEQSVEGIMQPKVKLALRTSGHLLLGVVRIYSRKAKYLLADCNEAFVKIKMAFRPGMVDLPEEHREAAVNAITLPEVFHDFDTALPELNDVDIEAQFSINQSRADEITMREDYGSLPMTIHDDGFGDIGFDADGADFMRDTVADPSIDENLINEDLGGDDLEHGMKDPMPGTSRSMMDIDSQHLVDDGFGGEGFGQEPAAGLFEGDLFGDAPLPESSLPPVENDSDDDLGGGWDGMGGHSDRSSSVGSRPPSAMEVGASQALDSVTAPSLPHIESPHKALDEAAALNLEALDGNDLQQALRTGADAEDDSQALETSDNLGLEQDSHEREEESFALAPIDASALKGLTKTKRKRKLIVDEVKNISGEEMKSQLANTADIITTLDLAPPTKRLMFWKETGGVEKLFALPSRDISARGLFKNYQRNITSRVGAIEDFSVLGPADVLALDQYQEQPLQTLPGQVQPQEAGVVTGNKRGRKRKVPLPEVSVEEPSIQRQSLQDQSIDVSQQQMLNETLMPPPSTTNISAINHPGMMSPGLPDTTPVEADIPIPFTPGGLPPDSLEHSSMTPSLNLCGMTPVGLHGDYPLAGMTPHHHGIDQLESIPNLPADQVSSILNGAGMDAFANMGYDDGQGASAGMSERIANDWNDDYDFPQSMGAHQQGDEQMENETDEQFEERVLNKRAAQMFVTVRAKLQKQDSLYLSDMTYRNNRKQAAQKFYSLLVLKKFQALEIRQDESYGDIFVTKGIMFDNPKL